MGMAEWEDLPKEDLAEILFKDFNAARRVYESGDWKSIEYLAATELINGIKGLYTREDEAYIPYIKEKWAYYKDATKTLGFIEMNPYVNTLYFTRIAAVITILGGLFTSVPLLIPGIILLGAALYYLPEKAKEYEEKRRPKKHAEAYERFKKIKDETLLLIFQEKEDYFRSALQNAHQQFAGKKDHGNNP